MATVHPACRIRVNAPYQTCVFADEDGGVVPACHMSLASGTQPACLPPTADSTTSISSPPSPESFASPSDVPPSSYHSQQPPEWYTHPAVPPEFTQSPSFSTYSGEATALWRVQQPPPPSRPSSKPGRRPSATSGCGEECDAEEDDDAVDDAVAKQYVPNFTLRPLPQELFEGSEARRAQHRHQVGLGRKTPEYTVYSSSVPKYERELDNPNHPVTPRYDLRISRRHWKKICSSWRQQLHLWDSAPHPADMSDPSLPSLGSLGLEPVPSQ